MHTLNPWDDAVMADLPVFVEPPSADAPASGSHVSSSPTDRSIAQVTLDPLYEPRRASYSMIGAGFGFPLVAGTLHTIHADLCVIDGNTCQPVPEASRGTEGGVSSETVPVYAIPVPEPDEDPWIDLSATWWGTLTLEEQGAQMGGAQGKDIPHPKGLLSSLSVDQLQDRVVWRVTQPANRPDLLHSDPVEIAEQPFRRAIPHARLNASEPGVYDIELAVKGDEGDLLVIDNVRVWVVQVDLDILKDPGVRQGKVTDDEEEETPGKVLVMNFDDDDCDGSGYHHGEALVTSDKDDPDGIVPGLNSAPECTFDEAFQGDNDLVALKLRPLSGPNAAWLADHARFVLEFDETNIALWRDQRKRPMDRMISNTTSFPVSEETTVWVEGRVPHGNIAGTRITLQLQVDGDHIPWVEDTVKVVVADPMFVMLGVGPSTQPQVSQEVKKLLNAGDVWEPEAIWIVSGHQPQTTAPISYSVALCQKQKKCEQWLKIGLQTENSVVIFDGHSNFGLGPAFNKASTRSIHDFVNAGRDLSPNDPDQGGLTAIDWLELLHGDGYPLTTIEHIPETPRNYRITLLDLEKFRNTGNPSYNPLGYYIFPGDSFRLFSGDHHCFTYPQECPQRYFAGCLGSYHDLCHYVMPGIGQMGTDAQIVIVDTGSDDIPAIADLKYRALFMRACNSGKHFIETFQHATYFYTTDESESVKASTIFLQAILDGKTPDEIRKELNTRSEGNDQDNEIYAYHEF